MRFTRNKCRQINKYLSGQLRHRCCNRKSPFTVSRISSKSALILYIVFTLATTLPGRLHAQQMQHRVRPGETLSKIAGHYGVSVQTIARANSIYNVNLIRAGRILIIPVPTSSVVISTQPNSVESGGQTRTPQATATKTLQEAPMLATAGRNIAGNSRCASQITIGEHVHTVHPGDTLFGLGRRYGVRISSIQQRNGLLTTVIRVNQCLIIPPGIQATPAPDRRRNSEHSPPLRRPTSTPSQTPQPPAQMTSQQTGDG